MSSMRRTASIDSRVVFSSSRTTGKSAATTDQGSARRSGVGIRGMSEPRRRRSRADYERGLPDHHDPTAGFAGARPAWPAVVLFVLGAIAAVDIVVILRRKGRGEPG